MLLARHTSVILNFVKDKLKSELEIKDLGLAKKILGMKIKMNIINEKLLLTQESYIGKVVKKFYLHDSKSI